MTTTTTPTTPEHGTTELLPLDKIQPSDTNPRKSITGKMIADLAESIRKVGVLQPILVRRRWRDDDLQSMYYEIVAGECRYRAALEAGLETIPATIRHLTDVEALELQVLENLHRNDLSPLEEAEGFRALLDAGGYTAATLAERLGKSKAAVYAALKLLDLGEAGRQALAEGKISTSVALLIARMEEYMQTAALGALRLLDTDISYREAQSFLVNRGYIKRDGTPATPIDDDQDDSDEDDEDDDELPGGARPLMGTGDPGTTISRTPSEWSPDDEDDPDSADVCTAQDDHDPDVAADQVWFQQRQARQETEMARRKALLSWLWRQLNTDHRALEAALTEAIPMALHGGVDDLSYREHELLEAAIGENMYRHVNPVDEQEYDDDSWDESLAGITRITACLTHTQQSALLVILTLLREQSDLSYYPHHRPEGDDIELPMFDRVLRACGIDPDGETFSPTSAALAQEDEPANEDTAAPEGAPAEPAAPAVEEWGGAPGNPEESHIEASGPSPAAMAQGGAAVMP